MTLKFNKLITFLFLFQFFVNRIFIGTYADSYTDMPHINFELYNYFLELVLIIIMMGLIKLKNDYLRLVYISGITLSLLIIELIQILIIVLNNSETFYYMALISYIRILLLIISNMIFILFFYNRKHFLDIFHTYIKITIFVSITALICYYLFNSTIQVYIGRGYPRIQGLLSEPSGLAPIITAAIYLSFYFKNYLLLIFSIITAVFSFSSIVYFNIIIVGVFILILKINMILKFIKNHYKSFFLFFLFFLFFCLMFIISNINFTVIDIFQRIFFTIDELINININDLDRLKELRLDRLWGFLSTISNLYNDNLLYTGYGLNGSIYIFKERYNDIIDYGLFAYLISSFGIIFGSIFCLLTLCIVLKILKIDFEIGIIVISFYIGTLFNSAGGIINYSLVYMFILKYIYEWNFKFKREIK